MPSLFMKCGNNLNEIYKITRLPLSVMTFQHGFSCLSSCGIIHCTFRLAEVWQEKFWCFVLIFSNWRWDVVYGLDICSKLFILGCCWKITHIKICCCLLLVLMPVLRVATFSAGKMLLLVLAVCSSSSISYSSILASSIRII